MSKKIAHYAGYFVVFVSALAVSFVAGRKTSNNEVKVVECPPPPEPQEDLLGCTGTLGQLLECRTQSRDLLNDMIENKESEKRALSMMASCCMVDEMYPEQCTDPLCSKKLEAFKYHND